MTYYKISDPSYLIKAKIKINKHGTPIVEGSFVQKIDPDKYPSASASWGTRFTLPLQNQP